MTNTLIAMDVKATLCITCPYCGTRSEVCIQDDDGNDFVTHVWFSSNESECEACGSHGEIQARLLCPHCSKSIVLSLESW